MNDPVWIKAGLTIGASWYYGNRPHTSEVMSEALKYIERLEAKLVELGVDEL